MGKIGFIDMEEWGAGKEAIPIHIFKKQAGNYELEETINLPVNSTPAAGLQGIDDFYLGLPLKLLNFRLLNLPFSDRQKLKEIIPFELDKLLLSGTESVVHDFLVLDKAAEGFNVLAVCADKVLVTDILSRLAASGIDPAVITSSELQAILDNKKSIAANLADFEGLSHENRIIAAKKELVANTFNLRTGQFSYTKAAEKTWKALRLTAVLSMLFALAVNADLLLRLISAKTDAGHIRKSMRSAYTELFPAEKKITDEVYQLRAHIKALKERKEAMAGISPLGLMLDLSKGTMQGSAFNEISLDRDVVTLKGEAASINALNMMKKRLAEFLTDVSVPDIKPSGNDRIYFTVIARLRTS